MKIVVSYRAAPRIRTWETGAMIAGVFRDLGHEVIEYAKVYESQEWVSYLKCDSPDLLIWCECGDPSPQYLELKSLRCPKFYWAFDVSYNPRFHKNLCNAMQFDWIFSANVNYQANFFGPKTSWLPYAADKRRHFRSLRSPKVMDVALVGSERPDRRKLINILRAANIDAQLISGVFKEDYIDALANAKIVINENPADGRGLLNMRFTESMAAGSCLLTQRGDGEDRVGTENVHFACYSTQDEAIAKCHLLLEQEDLRLRIAEAGQNLMSEAHTYHNRAKTILERFSASN